MGLSLGCECKKCGYSFEASVGEGLFYPVLYSETVAKMKEGQFGRQGKEFFEVFPDGAITCNYIVVQCNDCGQLMNVQELALYVPEEGYDHAKEDRNIPWSSACSGEGYDYISGIELADHYQLFEKYDHRCDRCNGRTSVVPGFTENMRENKGKRVRCPNCGFMMDIDIDGIWD